jgi:primosomal replication protein N
MENTANRAELCGSFVTLPSPSHENHGQRFYHFYLRVERLSGYADVLRVVVPERVLYAADLDGGGMLWVRGQVRSYSEHTPDGRRLRIFVFADRLECREAQPLNDVELTGSVCKPPILRRTPLGREICDLMLRVRRSCRRSDYLPVIAWGRTARMCAEAAPGDQLELLGRLQSREYTKIIDGQAEKRTAYEISVLSAQLLEDVSQLSLQKF